MSSTCFETEGSPSGRRFYVQVRYCTYLHAQYRTHPSSYHTA